MSPAARTSHSPPSNEEELGGTGLHSRSRNARAQARHRAKRKKYIETLEETVKRLQTIVDAAGLDPNAFPPPASPHPYALRELQEDNARLRRESDALRIQIAALTAHVSNGSHLYSSPASDAPTPPPERDPKKRKMSVERDHLYLAIPQVLLILVSSQDSHPGRTSPASASTSSLPSTVHTSNTSASSLVHSMLSPLQQQAVYNSILSGFNSSTTANPPHASRPASPPPPVPVSTFAQLPSTSLLATSLYPLLTLGIAGGAVSGELGAAAWNAFQQSQLQAQQAQQNQSNLGQQQSGLGQQSSGLPSFQPHPLPFMSQSQPMSTLSSSLDSVSSLPRMDSGSSALPGSGLPRIDSPSGLPQSLESLRTSSPGAGPSSFSSPRFEPSSARFESSRSNLFEVTNAASSTSNTSNARFDVPSSSRFDSSTSASRFDPVFDTTNSPHMLAGTPPGFSSSSSTPGFSAPGTRRSSSSSRRDDVQ